MIKDHEIKGEKDLRQERKHLPLDILSLRSLFLFS